ncbi:mesotocin receptor-like [Mytilus edulis]|uniref:mesotocin receptor-like n=1 Tax=Mytilus edulis TaxID=6550 RepID=UPI0039EFCA98
MYNLNSSIFLNQMKDKIPTYINIMLDTLSTNLKDADWYNEMHSLYWEQTMRHRNNKEMKINANSPMNFSKSLNSTDSIRMDTIEGFVVITLGLVCTIGNFSCMVLIVCHRKFRKTTIVILCHHCFLDLVKSLYLFPYGYSLMTSLPAPYCNWIGSSYVFIVTTSAYNMMALVVNQDYELLLPRYRHDDCSCVLFGIFIIWFVSFLLNLGISIIPSNTDFNAEIGICLFLYGYNYSYIIHVLWIILVTIAVSSSLMFFCRMRGKLITDIKRYKWRKIHESLTDEFEKHLDFNIEYGETDVSMKAQRKTILSQLRTTRIFMLIVISFIVFWYPLFILTLGDFHFKVTPSVYRILTIIAWSHPITTPILCSLVLRDIEFKGYTLRDISSNLIPLRRVSSRRHHYKNTDVFDFDCKSHLDNEVSDDHLQSEDEEYKCIGFANQQLIPDKVTSTV